MLNIHKNEFKKKNKTYFIQKLKFIIIFLFLYYQRIIKFNANSKLNELNKKYLEIQKSIKLKFHNKLNNKIRIGIYIYSLKNGGSQRLTSILINYLYNLEIYDLFLFTIVPKNINEYYLSSNIWRTTVEEPRINNLIKLIIKNKLDILIYNLFDSTEIRILKNLKNIKVIFYIHQSFLYWIYLNYISFKSLYKSYQNCSYIISLLPFENDYLFKKWGIKSIIMNNFITYQFDSVIPSDLSSKIILMIGRCYDKLKRFELGVKAMKYIVHEEPKSVMKIISIVDGTLFIQKLIIKLNLTNNIKFVGYTPQTEIYFKNASLHIFPSISESFGLVLCETKIYGIPNILIGLDYLSISKGGTIIIYNDEPLSIAAEAIKILKNYKYRKNLGKKARNSMKKYKNEVILMKWNKLILTIYNGHDYYEKLRKNDKKITKSEALNIFNNQIKLLKIRKPIFKNITINNIFNFTYMENLSIK